MKQPAELAQQIESEPQLPPGEDERFAGYGVMGLPFRSGHVLGLRRWPASSVGESFTSVWHRDPGGRWTFYQTADPWLACTRYFGSAVERVRTGPIELDWHGQRSLRIRAAGGAVDWTVELGSTVVTHLMSGMGAVLPASAWRSKAVLSAMGRIAGHALGAGRVQLTGRVPNGHHFDANPMLIWFVTASHAVVEDRELGPIGPLTDQARLADFYIPQRGIFAVANAHLEPESGRLTRAPFPAATDL